MDSKKRKQHAVEELGNPIMDSQFQERLLKSRNVREESEDGKIILLGIADNECSKNEDLKYVYKKVCEEGSNVLHYNTGVNIACAYPKEMLSFLISNTKFK